MKRFLFSDNGILKDYSVELENYHSGSAIIDFVAGEDKIFIGSELPFNSLFFKVASPNAAPATPLLRYWSGNEFRDMVEILDESNLLGIPFNQSGHMTWVPNKKYNWSGADTVACNGKEQVDGLEDVTIYDLYWTELSYDADVSLTLDWLGPKFCNNDDVINEYTLSKNATFIANYSNGKIDWNNEIVLASRLIIEDIKKKRAIVSGDQLLQRRLLRDACVSKVMQIIFKNMGDDYKSDAERAQSEYESRITKNNYGADLNNDGRLDPKEKGMVNGNLYR